MSKLYSTQSLSVDSSSDSDSGSDSGSDSYKPKYSSIYQQKTTSQSDILFGNLYNVSPSKTKIKLFDNLSFGLKTELLRFSKVCYKRNENDNSENYLDTKTDIVGKLILNETLSTHEIKLIFSCIQNHDFERILTLILDNKFAVTSPAFISLLPECEICSFEFKPRLKFKFFKSYVTDFEETMAYICVKYGYSITQDDFEEMTRRRIYCEYKKYNLQITDKINQICNELLFFPYGGEKNLDQKNIFRYQMTLKQFEKVNKYYKININLDLIKFYESVLPDRISKAQSTLLRYLIKNSN
jgi:hypothetical protein